MRSPKRTITLVLLIFIFSSLLSASVAWFAGSVHVEGSGDFSASSIAAYFANGDGSANDPYIIENANHLYNLAWLQNQGALTQKTYFKVCDETGQPIDLDMKGQIGGTDTSSGAIPPIGTKEHPFLGHFDGCGSTISNLWVSTLKTDWKERPEDAADFDTTNDCYVGLFGAISQEAIVENFVLDRVEIKTHVDATVGIICGYVDAMIVNVGVYNGIMTLGTGVTCESGYSLFGEVADRILWQDMPTLGGGSSGDGTAPGGDLLIDPNDYLEEGKEKFTELDAGVTKVIPNSVKGSAYYSGPLTITESKISKKKMWDMRNYDPETGSGAVDFASNTTLTDSMKKIKSMYDVYDAKNPLITIGAPFDANDQIPSGSTTTVVNKKGATVTIPQGCIWFEPQGVGTISMAFAATDQSKNRYAMLYICQRSGDTLTVVRKQEYVLPTSVLSNGQIVYYEYTIPASDARKYEYIIGSSNVEGQSSDFGFFGLTLAGTDITGGDIGGGSGDDTGFAPILYGVDYVITPTTLPSSEGYTNHKTVLQMTSSTVSAESRIYYLAVGALGSSRVYYYPPPGVTMTDISADKQSEKATSPTQALGGTDKHFSDRETQ